MRPAISKQEILFMVASITLLAPSAIAQDVTFSQADRVVQYPAQSVTQADINRDGYPDFLFGLNASLNIYTLKSDRSGNYVDSTIPTAYCPASPLAFGNFEFNGKNDLLVSSGGGATCAGAHNDTFGHYLNDGTGVFRLYNQFQGQGIEAAVTADFNGDKKLDIVTINEGQLSLYYGNGYGNFSGPFKIASLAGSSGSFISGFYNLIAGDFDANGCTDVAWTEREAYGERGFKSQLRVAYGDCHGNFWVMTPFDVIGEIDDIQVSDLDRDGVSDIVAVMDAAGQGVSNPTLQISYGRRSRSFASVFISDPSLTGPIQVADFNGDGYPDVAYISTSSSGEALKILEGKGGELFSGTSVQNLTGAANSQPVQLLAGDYNRDGKTDLALLTSGQGLGKQDFTILTNTSPYPSGTCVPFATPGIQVCSPSSTSGTTVYVLAEGTNTNPTVYMELWVDGVKRVGYGSTHELRTSLTLPTGSHQFDYYSYDASGSANMLTDYVTVK